MSKIVWQQRGPVLACLGGKGLSAQDILVTT